MKNLLKTSALALLTLTVSGVSAQQDQNKDKKVYQYETKEKNKSKKYRLENRERKSEDSHIRKNKRRHDDIRKERRWDDDKKNKRFKRKHKNGKGNTYGTHKFGLEGREFGQYRAWQARNKRNHDSDWSRLEDIMRKKDRTRFDDVLDILTNKRRLIKNEYDNKKISREEYIQLLKDLKYVQYDINNSK